MNNRTKNKMLQTKITLEEYIDLYRLKKQLHTTHESNRQFALKHKELLNSPRGLLRQWIAENQYLLDFKSRGGRFCSHLYRVSFFLFLMAFSFGILGGYELLSYSGEEPVNLFYFLSAVVVLPLFTMLLALLSLIRIQSSHNFVIHLAPAYWIEKIIDSLPVVHQDRITQLRINPLIANLLILKRSQLLSLLFSMGLFLSLIAIVITRDIAFGWSTTLQISAREMHSFVSLLALPWSWIFPNSLPSLELIEKSHFFRLGEHLQNNFIASASLLGNWWKYLALSTLFYALFLRALLYLSARAKLLYAIDKGAFLIEGVEQMLHEMQTPLITTVSPQKEPNFIEKKVVKSTISTSKELFYDTVIGWALAKESILFYNEREQISTNSIASVGGNQSLEHEKQVVESSEGKIVVYVKSWEPPVMDFIDFLEELSAKKFNSIVIYPLGDAQNNYQVSPQDLDMWRLKIDTLSLQNVKVFSHE